MRAVPDTTAITDLMFEIVGPEPVQGRYLELFVLVPIAVEAKVLPFARYLWHWRASVDWMANWEQSLMPCRRSVLSSLFQSLASVSLPQLLEGQKIQQLWQAKDP